jgi:hypothetical protein
MPREVNYTVPENYPFQSQSNVQTPDIEYVQNVEYLCINSSDRNVTAYPKVNSYRVDADVTFKNIHSIEVVSASVANQGTPLSLPYLILHVDGLDHIHFSNKNTNDGFAVLYLKPTTAAHIQAELGVLQRNVLTFKTPLASLNNITITIRKPDGTLFDFGESNGDVTSTYQNSFLFKIITIEKTRKVLNTRAVYQ